MKTTLDLPDDLVRDLKLKAINERSTLKQLATDLLKLGLYESKKTDEVVRKPRIKLPLIVAPKGAKQFELDAHRIHELESAIEIEDNEFL